MSWTSFERGGCRSRQGLVVTCDEGEISSNFGRRGATVDMCGDEVTRADRRTVPQETDQCSFGRSILLCTPDIRLKRRDET